MAILSPSNVSCYGDGLPVNASAAPARGRRRGVPSRLLTKLWCVWTLARSQHVYSESGPAVHVLLWITVHSLYLIPVQNGFTSADRKQFIALTSLVRTQANCKLWLFHAVKQASHAAAAGCATACAYKAVWNWPCDPPLSAPGCYLLWAGPGLGRIAFPGTDRPQAPLYEAPDNSLGPGLPPPTKRWGPQKRASIIAFWADFGPGFLDSTV